MNGSVPYSARRVWPELTNGFSNDGFMSAPTDDDRDNLIFAFVRWISSIIVWNPLVDM